MTISTQERIDVLVPGNYYESIRSGLGDEFIRDVYEAFDKIATDPQCYSYIKAGKEYRDLALTRFPYLVQYQIIDDNFVFIISVHNTYKRPLSL